VSFRKGKSVPAACGSDFLLNIPFLPRWTPASKSSIIYALFFARARFFARREEGMRLDSHAPPNHSRRLGFYHYAVVAACFMTLFMLWGLVVNAFAIFFKPVSESMGWGRGAFSLTLLMRSIGTAVSAPIAGRIIDRAGAKPMMLAGTVLIGAGLLLASRIDSLWQFCVIFIVIGCGLMCATVIPCASLISNWFVAKRGTALSAAFVGTSFGGMIMAPVSNWIILNFGWRAAFSANGAAMLVILIPLITFFVYNRPADRRLEPFQGSVTRTNMDEPIWGMNVKEALGSRVFWQIGALMFIIGFVTGGIHNHSVAYLTDIGHSPTRAAFLWSMVMMVMIGGKLSFGPLADRWGPSRAMAGAFLLYSLALAALLFAREYPLALVFAALYGFAGGAPLTLNPLLAMGNLGMKNFGMLYGVLAVVGSVGAATGPVAAGAVFDAGGSYIPIFVVFLILFVGGIGCSLSIRAPATIEAPASRAGDAAMSEQPPL